ncbi:MAG: folate-binding protein YgfZ [Proteobacteria bacterium]|nr:folate-binding protein YgfZ [Pseudomonadota bacterium]
MKAALLPDRGVVKVAGDDAPAFLNGLVTSDIGKVAPDRPAYAALLTPQGKIVVDAIIVRADDGGFLLDCPRALAAALHAKLNFYKLRAKVAVEDMSAGLAILAAWDGKGSTRHGLAYGDPRLPALGLRIVLAPDLATAATADLDAAPAQPGDYEAHRIGLAVPHGGVDFQYGDAFPHEADMDQLNGVDFTKGCFVGQEVVSRMEHRGTARKRVVAVTFDGIAPAPGSPILAGESAIGTMGSAVKGRGLALLRLDRAAEALARGQALLADGVALHVVRPDWARFSIGGETRAAS